MLVTNNLICDLFDSTAVDSRDIIARIEELREILNSKNCDDNNIAEIPEFKQTLISELIILKSFADKYM